VTNAFSADSNRCFPQVSERLFETSNGAEPPSQPNPQPWGFLLDLGKRKVTMWERLIPGRLSAPHTFGMLMRNLKRAFEAELRLMWGRADFYWSEVDRIFASLRNRPEAWEQTIPDAHEAGARMQRRFAREILFDTHAGFFQSLSTGERADSKARADFHLRCMVDLLPVAGPEEEDRKSLIAVIELRARALTEAKEWPRAIQLSELLLKCDPGNVEFEDLLIYATHSQVLARVEEMKDAKAVKALESGIQALEGLRSRFPTHLSVFEALGCEYFLLAIRYANSQQLSPALEAIVKAAAFDSDQGGLKETTEKLTSMMTQLQTRVAEIMKQIRYRPNARLTADGARMKADADRGSEPARAWKEKSGPQITALAREAYVCTIWRRAGLKPEGEAWAKKAESLVRAIVTVLNAGAQMPTEVAIEWGRAAGSYPELANVDHPSVRRWLTQRILPNAATDAKPAGALNCPRIPLPVETKGSGEEDLADWFFSPQGTALKVLAAAALVLMTAGIFLTARNALLLHGRDAAWAKMEAASAADRDLETIDAAEDYFSYAAPQGEEAGRSNAAADLYSQALVRWFAANAARADSDARARVTRFRERVMDRGYLEPPQAGGPQ
jgi:hypothetical protein